MLINSPNISGSLTVTGNTVITGSLTVAGGINATITGSATSASYVEYSNVANKPALISGSSQVTYSGLTGVPAGIVSGSSQITYSGISSIPSGIVSGSSQVTYSGLTGVPSGIVSSSTQITGYSIFATTGSNQFNGSQAITGSLTVTGQVVAQTLNVQQVTSSIVFSSGSNIFGNSLSNTQQFTGSVSVTGSLAISGTGAFSGALSLNSSANRINSGNELRFYRTDNGIYTQLYDGGAANGFVLDNRNGDGFSFQTAGTNQLRIASTGAATFSSSVRATADSSGRSGFFGGTSFGLRIDNSGSFNNGGSIIHGVDNTFVASYQKLSLNGSSLEFMTDYGTKLTIANSGAATFASSVTATSFEVGNGQFFKARRSSSNLLLDLLGIESGTDSTRLLITGDFNIKNGSLSTLFNMTTTGVTTFASTVTATGNVRSINTGVDGTFADAFVGVYSSNNNEQNAIQTSVSSVAQSSGFRFQASNGGGSAGRTTIVDFLRDRAIFNTGVGIGTSAPDSGLNINSGVTRALRIDTNAGIQGISMSPNSIFGIDEPGVGNGRFVINTSGRVGIGTTNPYTKLDVRGPIAMGDGATYPLNARMVKQGTTSVTFTATVGTIGAWRPGHAMIKVSGGQNGLQEYWAAWFYIRIIAYYASSAICTVVDSGGDTSSVSFSSTSNTSSPQTVTFTLTDSGGTTNTMIADIDLTYNEGIVSLS